MQFGIFLVLCDSMSLMLCLMGNGGVLGCIFLCVSSIIHVHVVIGVSIMVDDLVFRILLDLCD